MADRSGQQLETYLLLRRLGGGTFGDVYLAEDRRKRQVAIKILHGAFDNSQLQDFLREARIICLRHENIISVLDFGVEPSQTMPYIVMDYAAKGSLLTKHPRGTKLPLETIVSYVKQIAAGLQKAHDEDVIHRDVKPENILFDQHGIIKLGDFSISVISQNEERVSLEDSQGRAGTAWYMAPEQIQGKPSRASDQYALAIIIYEWLTGTPPFTGGIMEVYGQHIYTYPPSLRDENPSIPQSVEDIVMKALAKDPKGRFENVQMFANTLEKAYQQITPTDGPAAVRKLIVPTEAAKQLPILPDSNIGQLYGGYRLTNFLGGGDLGTVYLGEHIQSKHKAAIKLLSGMCYNINRQNFHNQAKELPKLIHPHIVRTLDFGVKGSQAFLVMEYAPNGSLRQRHPQGTKLKGEDILLYVSQCAAALQYAHDHNMSNGDVKPEKMLIGQNNKLLLSGFDTDINHTLDEDSTKRSSLTNYYNYMAPQQSMKGKSLVSGDQYSLGVIVYEWLCGELPFRGNNSEEVLYQHKNVLPSSLRSKNPSIPQAVEDIVMKVLAKDPKDRFESVQAFAYALERAYQPPRLRFDAQLGSQFGDYQLKQRLGSGSLGDVYLAEHVSLGSKVAVKIFKASMDVGEFRSKVRRIARLQHPNIVRVLESGIEQGKAFLVLDYAFHGSLYDHHRYSKLPLATVVEYVKQAGTALQKIHDHNMVLGILRPTDILLGDNNEVLLDGIDAIFATEEISHVVGTYTAPEQLNSTVLPASDQYTLALIAYELLSGKRLTRQETIGAYAHTSTPLISLKTLVPELPQAVADVIMKALSKDYKQRFVNVEDFTQALEDASTSKDESTTKPRNRTGQQFGKYQLIKILGRGGFADVYLGKHVEMETFAAIKVLHAQLTDQYASRFQTEARTIAQLKHQYIVRVLHFGVQDEIPYLVMDQAKATLRDIHPRGSVLPPKIILPYVKQVAAALQYAHDQRRIHRDIKPENMLLGPRNEVLLSDFGLATIVNTATIQNTKNIAGTPIYMAPEQFKMEVSPASDQYSLGIVVYEWLTSEPPFTEGNFAQLMYQHLEVAPPSIREKVPTLSSDIERVVMIALAKDPKQRFGSIQAFANAFEQACR